MATKPLPLGKRNPQARARAALDQPQPDGREAIAGEAASTTAMRRYTIQSGDTLRRISRHFYGTSTAWEAIFRANQDRLTGPAQLQIGTEIRIPPRPGGI